MTMQYLKPGDNCQPVQPSLVDRMLEYILPMRCLLCRGSAEQNNICQACFSGLPGNHGACLSCALPLAGQLQGICAACLARPPPWSRAHVPLAYEFPVDILIQQLKFKRQLAAGRALAWAMTFSMPQTEAATPACLVPVPLHLGRRLIRGFNQAQELARHISRSSQFTMQPDWLRRHRRTIAQSGLTAEERRRNLRGAFSWHGPSIKGCHVTLVDDVMTTGSTLAECTRVLLRAGCKKVDVWAAARA